ncbi:MAG: tripartite tricarboxylate transporter TctB family protein [Bacillota bacterium]|nr:tripartite tricarboxylate transporter TctB family protein [Bacillota bacterium]
MTKQNILGELILKLILLIYGLYYFIETITMDISYNARIYPFIISLAFNILMIMLTSEVFKKYLEQAKNDRQSFKIITPEAIKLFSTYAAGILLIALTLLVNYWLAIIVALPLLAYVLEDKKFSLISYVFLPVGMIIIVYIIFVRFLSVRLPVGF